MAPIGNKSLGIIRLSVMISGKCRAIYQAKTAFTEIKNTSHSKVKKLENIQDHLPVLKLIYVKNVINLWLIYIQETFSKRNNH